MNYGSYGGAVQSRYNPRMRNIAFRYLEDIPASEEQLAHVQEILERPYEDLSELSELVEDEAQEFYESGEIHLES